jgi:hypothetical protein
MAAKRPVAPDTPIRGFPTPNVNDLVVSVDVDSRLPGYKPLEYGSLHPDQTRFPGAKLVYQEPIDGADTFVRRIYVTDRANQTAYNYAIKYSGGSLEHPIYTRTYIEPRETYVPFPEGSSDPLFEGAFIVDEEAEPAEGELSSLYLKVIRVFETIPGPEIESKRVNERGDLETVTTRVVPSGTVPEPDGLLITSSQVQYDSVDRGVKTTSKVGSHSTLSGKSVNTLGSVETLSDEIVTPSTVPVAAEIIDGKYFISDEVSPLSASKSRRQRRTISAVPPSFDFYEVTQDRAVVKNTVSFFTRSTLPPPVVGGAVVDITDAPMDFPWIRRTTKSLRIDPNTGLPILPPGRIEWRTTTWTFPGIIYTWKARFSDDQIRANLSFFENRFPVSMTVAAKQVVTYHYTQPDLSSLNFFKVITRPWARIFFDIPDNTVHPPAPITLAQQSVERGGIAFDIQGGQASEPSFYTPGDELLVGGEVRQWWGDFYEQTLTYVREPI